MADIILYNDQDQEQTLAGVEKLVVRGEGGNKAFMYDPSGGSMIGYKITEYPFEGLTIPGAGSLLKKIANYPDSFAFMRLTAEELGEHDPFYVKTEDQLLAGTNKYWGYHYSDGSSDGTLVSGPESGRDITIKVRIYEHTAYPYNDAIISSIIKTGTAPTFYYTLSDTSKYSIKGTLFFVEKIASN